MSIIAKAAIGPSVTALLLTTAARQRPGWAKPVESGTAHPGFMKLIKDHIPDPMLSHPNGWSDNDNYTLEEHPTNRARVIVPPGETTVIWYGDDVNGLTAQQIADMETAAGRPRTAAQVTANWIRDQTTTDYGKHPDRAVITSLLNSAIRLRAEGISMWALFKSGQEINSTYLLNLKQGESMLHPILVSTYGGEAPAKTKSGWGNNYTPHKQANIVIQNMDLSSIGWVNSNADNWLLADIVPEHEITSDPTGNRLTFHACKQSRLVKEAPANGATKWSSGSADRSSGVFLGPGKNQYFKYNWSYHNGWADNYDLEGDYLDANGNPAYGQPPNFYSHNFYMSGSSIGQSWLECLSVMSPFSHLQKRSGGEEIVCGYIGGNAYGIEGNGYVLLKLETQEQVDTFKPGDMVSFSDSDVTLPLDPGVFATPKGYQAINFADNLPAGFDPVGRTVTTATGGYGVVVKYDIKGTYSAKTAVVIEDAGYKDRNPTNLIGKRMNGFNGLTCPDFVHDWVLLCNAADPNNPDDVALKAGAKWNVSYEESKRFYSDLTVFNWGEGNDRNADHISQSDRDKATLGRFVDQLRGMPAGTHTRFMAAEYLDTYRNPGLLAMDYIDYMAKIIGKPSPKRTTPGVCVWTAWEKLSGHNADQPRNWTADGVNFTFPIDGDDLILDGGEPHWPRTCRANDISLGQSLGVDAHPVLFGGLMSSNGVVSGNGRVTLKNGSKFWYLGTNTGNQKFDGDGGQLLIGGTAPITGLDVRVGDAGADGFTEVVVLSGSSATFTDLHLTGRAVLKLDGIDNGTAVANIGNLTMTKVMGHLGNLVAPRIGKFRSGHFGVNAATGQPYNPSLTGNVTITGTITAVGYATGDVIVDGSKLNDLTTTDATFVGCQRVGNNIVAT